MLQQALGLHQGGQTARAQAIYQEILQIEPKHSEALHLLGLIAAQDDKLQLAAELMDKAIESDPRNVAACCNRATVLKSLGQLPAALQSYDRALAIAPDLAAAHFNRATVLHELKSWGAALEGYDRAITLDPGLGPAHYGRGSVLCELKDWHSALESYDRAIALDAGLAASHAGRGAVLYELRQLDASLQSYDRAIALQGDLADAHFYRGRVLKELDRWDEAFAEFDRAIAIKPDSHELYSNRGAALNERNRLDEALADYDRAIAIKPDFAPAYCNRAYARFLLGDLENGWKDFEWRWKNEHCVSFQEKRTYSQALWLGAESLAGRTILLHAEQGFGDTLQFCRYVPLVARMGATVILEVPEPLVDLVAGLDGAAHVIAHGDAPPAFDFHCPLLSLPLAFKTTLATVPAQVPYLGTNPQKRRYWHELLGERRRLRVGLLWSGGFRPNRPELWSVNSRRNIPLLKLAPLKHPAIEFYSLQKGQPAESELSALMSAAWDGPELRDLTHLLNDFSDTAALIEQLDLVISVDTSTAHLAGALGKPVWILNRFDTCWRWMLERTDSPWYPTSRVYRQLAPGEWDGVVQRITTDLHALVI
jgi:tetratricopeptide (TPR) repeat protein